MKGSVRIAVGAALLLGAGLALGQAAPHITVALPDFENAGAKPELDWLRSGLPLMLASDLVNLEGVSVVEREQVRPLLEEIRLRQAGIAKGELPRVTEKGAGADVVILGSFEQKGSQLTLKASIFDTSCGEETHIPSITGDARDALALESEFFHRLASILELDLTQVRRSPESTPLVEEVTLAVIPFLSITPASEAVSGDGLADLVAAELSKVPAVTLVERERVRDILRELELSAAGLSDQTDKILEAGNMLGAQVMLLGSYAAVGPDIRVDARLVTVPSGDITNVISARGSQSEVGEVAERLALAAVSQLRLLPDQQVQAKMEEEGANSLEAYLYYSMAKDDARLWLHASALRNCQRVAYIDPDFRNIHLEVGLATYRLGNFTQALEVFEAHLPHYIEKGTLRLWLFVRVARHCYMELERFDKALAFEPTFKSVLPDEKVIAMWKGRAKTSEQRIEEINQAKEKAEREIAEAPAKVEEARKRLAIATTDLERYEAKLALAEAYKMWRRTDDAIEAYVDAIGSFPGSEDVRELWHFAFECLHFADYCQARDRTEVARTHYLLTAQTLEECAARDESGQRIDVARAYTGAASWCYGKLDDAAGARRALRKGAIANVARSPSYALKIAERQLRDNKLAAVIREMVASRSTDVAASVTGDRPLDYERRAATYYAAGMRQEATAEVRRFLERYPDVNDPRILEPLIRYARPLRNEIIKRIVRMYFENREHSARQEMFGRKWYAAHMLAREIAVSQLNSDRHKRFYVTALILMDEFSGTHPGVGECYRNAALYLRARDRGEERKLDPLLRHFRASLDYAKEDMTMKGFIPVRRTPQDEKEVELVEKMIANFHKIASGSESDTEEQFRSWLSEDIIPMIEGALQGSPGDFALTSLLCKLYFLMGDKETSDNYFREGSLAAPEKAQFLEAMAEFYENENEAERAEKLRTEINAE